MDAPWLLGTTMHEAAIRHRPYAIHCHDLTTAVIGLSAARTTGAYCLCDFHEWYSENGFVERRRAGVGTPPVGEKSLLPARRAPRLRRADAVITVCDSIARELEAMAVPGTRRVNVIRNIPSLDRRAQFTYRPLRESLGLGADQFILLWQGGTGPSRMIEPIIEALAHAPS
jgi:hypothetical protein